MIWDALWFIFLLPIAFFGGLLVVAVACVAFGGTMVVVIAIGEGIQAARQRKRMASR